jgi:hypothetical protein
MVKTLRVIRKFFRFSREIMRAVLDYRRSVRKAGLHEDYPAKAEWLQRWSRRVLRSLDVEWSCEGKIPDVDTGLYACELPGRAGDRGTGEDGVRGEEPGEEMADRGFG